MHDEQVDIQEDDEIVVIKLDMDDDEVLEKLILLHGVWQQEVEQVFIDNDLIENKLVHKIFIHHFHMDDEVVLVVKIDMLEKIIKGILKVQLIDLVKLKVEIFELDDEVHDHNQIMHDDDQGEGEQYVLCGERVVHSQIMQNEKKNM